MKKLRKNKGITLIALIITIIVMLILVGVTVAISLNEGLFDIAKEAKAQTEREKEREQLLSVTLGEEIIINDNAESITISKYEARKLNAIVSQEFRDETINWSSSNSNIVEVTEDGEIHGISVGEATITATSNDDNEFKDTIQVIVTESNFTISIACRSDVIGLNEVMTLTPVFSYPLYNQAVTWTISNSSIGFMKGNVFCPREGGTGGTMTITARSNLDPFTSGSIDITVDPNRFGLKSISPINAVNEIRVGETVQLGVTYNPENATNKNITWQLVELPNTKPDEIAKVDSNGLVTGLAQGNVIIFATSEDSGCTAMFTVTVEP